MLETTLGGRYKIIATLGKGGFGQTYLACDEHLPGKPRCVVKQLKPLFEDAEAFKIARRLFDEEAQVLYKLGTHDQIPRLFAHFEENQEFYLVQEFIDGEDLEKQLAAEGKWSEAQVVNCLQDILKILEFVHQQGVIHRDIKPANLIRGKQDGKIFLIDFGAVKQLSVQTITHEQPTKPNTAGTIIGTPGYMPAEQQSGHPLPCSDIYAVGMVGIQALTGLHPMQLPRDTESLEVIWRDRANVGSAVAEVLSKMVRYHHRERYQNATEALQALQQLNEPLPPPPPPPPPSTSSRRLRGIGIGAAVLFMGGGYYLYRQRAAVNICSDTNVPSGVFNYGGSTSWAPIRDVVDKTLAKSCPRFKLRYVQTPTGLVSSDMGIRMLIDDKIAFAQSSRQPKNEEYQQAKQKGASLDEIGVAIDGIAIAVNHNLNVSKLTVAQLKDIYIGRVTNWNQVGGPNQKIVPYSRPTGGTFEYFVKDVLGQPLAANVESIETTTQAIRKVAKDPGGIYYASAPEVIGECSIKPLPLVSSQSGKAILPYQEPIVTDSNCPPNRKKLNLAAMQTGDYPLTRTLYVIVKQNQGIEEQAGKAYADILLSPKGQELIENAGFVKIRP